MNGLAWTLLIATLGASPADTVVVCPPVFRAALQPWVEYRTAQGHVLQVVDSAATAEGLRTAIRAAASGGQLKSVVLVGDAPAESDPAESDPEGPLPAWAVPTKYAEAKINRQWGSEPEIATDAWFADLDNDALPDLAIGRMSVQTPESLSRLVQKIIAYETRPGSGTWRRRVHLVAGVGGFGRLADQVLEMATRKFVTEGIPPAYATTMTYGSWQSPYCPDPRQFHDVTLQRLNQGCLFWVYIGHGHPSRLDYVQVPGGAFRILDTDDAARFQALDGQPIALMLACYTGAFDRPTDCLAEVMLRSEGGPIAALCGSRVTMPYAMAVMCDALMEEYFQSHCQTLGELLLRAKRKMVRDDPDNSRRLVLDALAMAISPAREQLPDERQEHVLLFNLIGDPLLRMPHPQTITVSADRNVTAGQALSVTLDSPVAGPATVELVCRRDRSRNTLPSRPKFHPTHEFLASFNGPYREINDPVWVAQPLTVPVGSSQITLEIPANAHGPSHVRVVLNEAETFALGSADVFIRRPLDVGDSEP